MAKNNFCDEHLALDKLSRLVGSGVWHSSLPGSVVHQKAAPAGTQKFCPVVGLAFNQSLPGRRKFKTPLMDHSACESALESGHCDPGDSRQYAPSPESSGRLISLRTGHRYLPRVRINGPEIDWRERLSEAVKSRAAIGEKVIRSSSARFFHADRVPALFQFGKIVQLVIVHVIMAGVGVLFAEHNCF